LLFVWTIAVGPLPSAVLSIVLNPEENHPQVIFFGNRGITWNIYNHLDYSSRDPSTETPFEQDKKHKSYDPEYNAQ
jgi:hypothetical protein